MRTVICLFFLVFLFSCSEDNSLPAGIIPDDKMGTIIWQLIQSDQYINSFVTKDSAKTKPVERMKVYQRVFDLNKTSKLEFEKSYAYYLNHPDRFKVMFDSITVRAGRQRGDAYKFKPKNITK